VFNVKLSSSHYSETLMFLIHGMILIFMYLFLVGFNGPLLVSLFKQYSKQQLSIGDKMENVKVKKISLKTQVRRMLDDNKNIMAGEACAFAKKCDRFIEGACPSENNKRSNTFKCGIAVVKAEALFKKK